MFPLPEECVNTGAAELKADPVLREQASPTALPRVTYESHAETIQGIAHLGWTVFH